ncbi:MAG: hypothetical protein J5966_03730, partial [Lachnospiraceae bacterium]|nr:hypothetical protein [Lachnospiraceae bacterium]
ANQAVIALEEQALTTIVGCFARNGLLYYQSVGDSRFYYFRDGKKFAQTKDDSVCQAAVDLGTMDYEDIRTSEDRSRLLKVLGNDPGLKIMRQYEPVRMQGGDAFLVCSDGFWEHVLDNEMEETLAQSSDAEEWLNRMLKIQYSRAKNRDDNYTVICCIVEDKDAAADGPSDAASGEKPDTPYNVPYEGSFRRYTENENVTLSYDADGLPERSRDSRQEEAGSGVDGYDEEYYDDEYEDYDKKPKKRGFFARLFGR